jgi:hypothetical protein
MEIKKLTDLSIKEIKDLSLEEILRTVDAGGIAEPYVITLPLDNALIEKQISVAGNYFGVFDATDINVKISVKFNSASDTGVTMGIGQSFVRPIKRIFITSNAQAGKTITIIVASLAPDLFSYLDQRSQTLQASYLADILAELQGEVTGTFGADISVGTTPATLLLAANTNRKSCMIFSDIANTDYIYIGFTNTVTTSTKIVALVPGAVFAIDDYRGAIYGISGTAAQKVSATEV